MTRHPKTHTLTRRRDFLRVQRGGKRFKDDHLAILIDRGGEPTPRVGFTVSRKVGNAVTRNRVRRRLKEIVRLRQEILCNGFDYVIIAFPSTATASYPTIERSAAMLLDLARDWALSRSSSSG